MGLGWMGPWPIIVSYLMCVTCQFMHKRSGWAVSSRLTFPDTSQSANSFELCNCALVLVVGSPYSTIIIRQKQYSSMFAFTVTNIH